MDRTSPASLPEELRRVKPAIKVSMAILCGITMSSSVAVAQQATGGEQPQFGTSGSGSASYKKEERLLPGENVVTPSGQKMKVWSTEGPVSVSRAPEPFAAPNTTTINPNVGVIVDGRQENIRPGTFRQGENRQGVDIRGNDRQGQRPQPPADTFEVPPTIR